jgi:hypothetical protein
MVFDLGSSSEAEMEINNLQKTKKLKASAKYQQSS